MFRFVVFSAAVATTLGQLVEDQDAKILKEQRFNNGDGRTGAAFATENEILFREESDADGTRIGQYSYIGADGKTYTVKYSAGKEGFRIIDGDHIPSGGQDAALFGAEDVDYADISEPVAPVAAPAIKPAPIDPVPIRATPIAAEPVATPDYDNYDDEPVDPDFNPFINPHDPTHRNFAFNKNGAKFAPKVPGVLDSSNVPNCAGCEGLNPFVNPFDASHQQPAVLAGHLAGHQAGALAVPANARPTGRIVPANARPAARRPVGAPAALPEPQLLPILDTTTTPAPKRFFPPGQISLNRFETGFNFDFSS